MMEHIQHFTTSSCLDTSLLLPGIPGLPQKHGSAAKSLKLAEFLVDVYFQGLKWGTFSRLFTFKEFPDYAVAVYNW